MRYVRIGVILLFIGAVVATVALRFTQVEDKTIPVISCSEKEIEAKCSVTDEELLKYVTAYDAKDGELTGKIIVEGISKFVEIGRAEVTYSVCDSSNNVAKLKKPIVFTDYHAPSLSLADGFCFAVDEKDINILSHINASDMFDGSIHRKITIVASEFDGTAVGKYPVTFKVSNSMGDYTIAAFNAYVHSEEYTADIILNTYTKYIKVGDTVDLRGFLKGVTDIKTGRDSKKFTVDDVVINASQLKTNVPGIYDVFYTIKDPDSGKTAAWTRAIVVCEEK